MAQPDLIPMPFAENATPGTIEPIPATTPTVPQGATWSTGFPQVTMQPLAAGGIPPRGQNFNGVLNALSRHIFHMQGGGQYKWSDDHGPYSIGDVLQSDDGLRSYVSVVDNNTDNFNTNPSAIGNTWLPWGGGAASESVAGLVRFGTSAGTAAQGNDSRIVNALQRGNNLSDVTNPATARTNLGLGTAATRNVGKSAGNVMEVGAFGLGGRAQISNTETPSYLDLDKSGFYGSYASYQIIHIQHAESEGFAAQLRMGTADNRIFFNSISPSGKRENEIYHTGNILKTTGYNDSLPMSQKAVTDALNLKANKTELFSGNYNDLTNKPSLGSASSANVLQGTGNSTVNVMSQNAVTDALNTKNTQGTGSSQTRTNSQNDSRFIQGGSVVQGTGSSTTDVMSQKAVTDALNTKANLNQPGTMGIGVGQEWQNVKSSRDTNTTYTNTTGRPIMVAISRASSIMASLIVDGVTVGQLGTDNITHFICAIVPAGSTYRFDSGTINTWAELR